MLIETTTHMVTGLGGNTTVRVDPAGLIIVDTKNLGEPNYNQLMDLVKSVSQAPVKYVFVTHHHQDHSGNIASFQKAGVPVIVHANLNKNLETYSPQQGKPEMAKITYTKDKKVKVGKATAEAHYFGRGHTNGDTFVWFPDVKVLSAGDMVATGRAGSLGVLIKGGEALQRLAEIGTVVADKTGTLTEGRPTVTDVIAVRLDRSAVLSRAAAVELLSEHPLGEAIVRSARAADIAVPTVRDFHGEPGRGVGGTVDGERILVGSAAWMDAHDIPMRAFQKQADTLASQGRSNVFVANENTLIGVIGIADPLRTEARDVVTALKRMGVEVVMLTGDRRSTANRIAEDAGIDSVIAEVLPAGKVEAVRSLQLSGQAVAMKLFSRLLRLG